MMSVTTPDNLLGGPDTRPAGEVAVESITIVHEGISRASAVNVSEITHTKICDRA